MPDCKIDVEVEVWCGTCGAGLCRQSDLKNKNGTVSVTVDVCEKCKTAAYDDGYSDGENSVS